MNKPQFFRFSLATAVILAVAGAGINLSVSHRTPSKDPPLRLVLNVPAHQIFVFEHGVLTHQYRVGVGMPGNETPAGSYHLTQAIWNPWWNPPSSKWAEGRKPESPGPKNPMGRVKMNFAPLLYIHGTWYRGSVGDPSSHGCVHVMNDDLIELARIVHKYATPSLDTTVLDELADNSSDTREINFRNSIPFDVVYDLATVQDTFLHVYPDVYNRVSDKTYLTEVKDVLSENGIAPDEVDDARLTALMNQAKTTRVAVPLSSVLLAPAAEASNVKGSAKKRAVPNAGAGSGKH